MLNPFPNKPWFLRVCSTCLLKTLWEKEKLLVTSNFSFSHSVFYTFVSFCHFHQLWNCRLLTLSVWKSPKFVVWERVKRIFQHSSTVVFWMEYFWNTVLSHWNTILLSAVLHNVVIRLAGALHLDLFRTARTCSEEHGTRFQNIPLI